MNLHLLNGVKNWLRNSSISHSIAKIRRVCTIIESSIERNDISTKMRKKIEKLDLTTEQALYLRKYLRLFPYIESLEELDEFSKNNKSCGFDEFYGEYQGSMIWVYKDDDTGVAMQLSFGIDSVPSLSLDPYVLFKFDHFHIRVSLLDPVFILHKKREIDGVDPYIEKIIEVMDSNYYEFVAYFNERMIQFIYDNTLISKYTFADKTIDSYNEGKPYYDELRKKKFKVEKPVY